MTETRKTIYLILLTLLLLAGALSLQNISLTFAALVAAAITVAQ